MQISPTLPLTALDWTDRAIEFVRSIGLSVRTLDPGESLSNTFVPGIRIQDGGLIVDRSTVFPGDVLHEAGHLATIPAKFRPLASGTLGAVRRAMSQYLEDNPEGLMSWPEDPLCRGILQSDETEATAWQYAAATHIGLPTEWLFPEGSFNGESAESLQMLQHNAYLGINGLQTAGWTCVHPLGKLPVYPKLAFWLHGGAAQADGTS